MLDFLVGFWYNGSMETLKKRSLFWDVAEINPQKNSRFVIGRILAFGDQDDFKWAEKFYGEEKIKQEVLNSRSLDRKSLSFWRQFFNLREEDVL